MFMFVAFVCLFFLCESLLPSGFGSRPNYAFCVMGIGEATGSAANEVVPKNGNNREPPRWAAGQHIVVLSSGLMGNRDDLTYLSERLQEQGCVVLRSAANELVGTLQGVVVGGKRLARELQDMLELRTRDVQQGPQLRAISFVGNSLGGLYVRYAVQELFDEENGTIAGLEPHFFLTIATPHMGVRRHTFLEDYVGRLPAQLPFLPAAADFLKRLVAHSMQQSGRELFSTDRDQDGGHAHLHRPRAIPSGDSSGQKEGSGGSSSSSRFNQTLLYRMATEEQFLVPLRAFRRRRLLANLQRDFVVPLGTAAFLSDSEVDRLRAAHAQHFGVVEVLHTTPQPAHDWRQQCELSSTTTTTIEIQTEQSSSPTASCTVQETAQSVSPAAAEASIEGRIGEGEGEREDSEHYSDPDERRGRAQMRRSLDGCGWEKYVVHFHGTVPLAHNKIAALTKYTPALDALLGFSEGRWLMNDTALWLAHSEG